LIFIFCMAFQGDSIYWVEVEKVVPNPFQPRREFDEQKLAELADSVRMYGILQPLTVTRNEVVREDGTFYTEYELIAGERRLRASKLAGLLQVPVIIREGEDSEQEKLELAIIENLQREDLNAVDRALAFRQLADVFGLSHTQVGKKVGRSREYVSNSIRLLALPDYMLNSLRLGEMSEGHSRTLLMLNDRPEEQDVVFREILLKKLSVREVERIVRKIATDKVRKKGLYDFDTELIEMEKKFMETLGTRVQIQKTDYGGRLTIDYFSVEDLDEMLNRMKTEESKSSISEPSAQLAALVANTPLAEVETLPREPDTVPEQSIVAESTTVLENEAENHLEAVMNTEDEVLLANTDRSNEESVANTETPDAENRNLSSSSVRNAVPTEIEETNQSEYFAIKTEVKSEAPVLVTPVSEDSVSKSEAEVTASPTEDINLSQSAASDTVTLHLSRERVSYLAPQIIAAAASVPELSATTEAESTPEKESVTDPAENIKAPEDDDSSLYSIRHFSI
jgi:ParB family chromosome partitioning protein